MKTFRKDIIATLVFKLSLLFLLWFICFKPIEKNNPSPLDHFLGTALSKLSNSNVKDTDLTRSNL